LLDRILEEGHRRLVLFRLDQGAGERSILIGRSTLDLEQLAERRDGIGNAVGAQLQGDDALEEFDVFRILLRDLLEDLQGSFAVALCLEFVGETEAFRGPFGIRSVAGLGLLGHDRKGEEKSEE
jgi:hypothetical protein